MNLALGFMILELCDFLDSGIISASMIFAFRVRGM
jgi:hypothetical protein